MSAENGAKPPNAGKGRPKGVPNKNTKLLKDAILEAAERAGDKEGMVGYLTKQAKENPGPFMALMGKVLPVQVDGAVKHTVSAEPMSENEWARRYNADLAPAAGAAEKPH